jgi:8-oxo-dGTP diphosphatase
MSRSISQAIDQRFNVLVGAAAVYDDLLLLLKRSERETFLPKAWGIPAGQVQFREDPVDASRRELFEETGLRGKVINLIGYSRFQSERNRVQLDNLQLNFLITASSCDVKLDPLSHCDFRWISLDDLENRLLDDFTKKIAVLARECYKQRF